MRVNITIDNELENKLKELKKLRFTKSNAQIVREALNMMAEFFLEKDIHKGIKNEKSDR